MTTFRPACFVAGVLMALPLYAGEVVHREGFEEALADWGTYRTGEAASVAAQTATLKVVADSAYRVFMNGRPVAQGTGTGQVDDVDLFLQRGQNVIAVEVDGGAAALRIEAPGLDGDRVRWRMAEPGARAVAQASDDRTWESAPEAGTHAEVGTIFGAPGAPAVLRHTLLWEESRIWPTQEPAVHIAAGTNQSIHVRRLGLPGKVLEGWTLFFGMPEAFDFHGVTGYYKVHGDYSVESVEVREVDGRRLRVAEIRAGDPDTWTVKDCRAEAELSFEDTVAICEASVRDQLRRDHPGLYLHNPTHNTWDVGDRSSGRRKAVETTIEVGYALAEKLGLTLTPCSMPELHDEADRLSAY